MSCLGTCVNHVRFQYVVCFGCLLFAFGCSLLLHSGSRRWIANIHFKTIVERRVHNKVLHQPSSSKKIQQEHLRTGVFYLTQLLEERLALPNDALKIDYRSPCKEHENDFHPCIKENCSDLSGKSPLERVENLVSAPQFQLSDEHLKNILRVVSDVPAVDIIIASASSSNHFKEMQAMFEALHRTVYPRLNNFSVILFDIGLKKRQLRLTQKYCKCQVLSFPFKLFPPHVRKLLCYSWKAIIIRALITKARKLLIWQDSSVRWTKKFFTIFQRAMLYGQQVSEDMNGARIPSHTLLQMFAYMGEQACQYYSFPEIQCGLQVLRNDPFVVQAVLNPWTRCALEPSCICPVDPESVISCSKDITSPGCHRFDQSAMSIILSKLYASERYRIMIPEYSKDNPKYVNIKRGDKRDKYFSRQREWRLQNYSNN